MLQSSDGEDGSAPERQPLQPSAGLGSIMEEPEVQRLGLSTRDREEAPDSPSAKPRLFQEDDGEESGSDDVLMEDDQVADFASSMLAAISCWHYRARALLSAGFAPVRLSVAAGIQTYNPLLPARLTPRGRTQGR